MALTSSSHCTRLFGLQFSPGFSARRAAASATKSCLLILIKSLLSFAAFVFVRASATITLYVPDGTMRHHTRFKTSALYRLTGFWILWLEIDRSNRCEWEIATGHKTRSATAKRRAI